MPPPSETTSAAATSPYKRLPDEAGGDDFPSDAARETAEALVAKERRAAYLAIISGPTRSGTSSGGLRTSSTLATRTARGEGAGRWGPPPGDETGRRGAGLESTGACPTRRARPT